MSALRFPHLSIPKGQQSISLDEFRRLQAEAGKAEKVGKTGKGKTKGASTPAAAEKGPASGRAGKYNAIAIETEHGRFDSKMEYKRYLELLLLLRAGRIRNLRRQISYPLVIGDTLVCTYIADFVYEEDGREVVEDSKGFKTREYLLKKRLMKKVFDIDIFETGHKKNNKSARRRSST